MLRSEPLLVDARIMTFEWDLARDVLQLSSNAVDILGLPNGRRRKYSALVNIHPEDRAPHRARLEAALNSGGRYASEFRYVRPRDRKVLTLKSHGQVERGAGGGPARVRGFVLDVTERADVERALRAKRDELQLILDAAPAMIWYKDRKNRILRCNEAAARAMGMTPAQMVGASVADLYPGQAARYHADDLEVLATGRPKLGIVEPIDTAGGRRWIETDKLPYRAQNGRIIGLIVFSKDVTERRRAEEILRRSESLQREFVAHVSHEFRTPVSAIKGFAETLRNGGLADLKNREAFVRIIESHADRLSWLIENLLTLSSLDSSEAKLELETVPLAEFLSDYAASIASLSRARKTVIRLAVAPELAARADRPRLLQVIENLLGNALKYGRSGGWIRISARRTGRSVVVDVADNGPGIPRSKLPRVFEPFFKISRKSCPGSGLGLHIVKRIVEAHGGKVWVESRPRRGTTFRFTVPAAS